MSSTLINALVPDPRATRPDVPLNEGRLPLSPVAGDRGVSGRALGDADPPEPQIAHSIRRAWLKSQPAGAQRTRESAMLLQASILVFGEGPGTIADDPSAIAGRVSGIPQIEALN